MSKFGDRLKALREDNDILSKDFAKAMNVEAPTISNWERGVRFPKEEMLVKIADYFNCSLDYLLGRTDNPDAVVYAANFDNQEVEIEVDKSYPKLTPQEVNNLIEQLKEVGFNVETLIAKSKKEKTKD